jgi:hypothetical protein
VAVWSDGPAGAAVHSDVDLQSTVPFKSGEIGAIVSKR